MARRVPESASRSLSARCNRACRTNTARLSDRYRRRATAAISTARAERKPAMYATGFAMTADAFTGSRSEHGQTRAT